LAMLPRASREAPRGHAVQRVATVGLPARGVRACGVCGNAFQNAGQSAPCCTPLHPVPTADVDAVVCVGTALLGDSAGKFEHATMNGMLPLFIITKSTRPSSAKHSPRVSVYGVFSFVAGSHPSVKESPYATTLNAPAVVVCSRSSITGTMASVILGSAISKNVFPHKGLARELRNSSCE
jgi:hypothetical protein